MAKVIFEFDESEDRQDINIIVNRHKLMSALLDIYNYRKTLYKGYETETVIVKDDKVLGKITDTLSDYDGKGEFYIKDDVIINKIDDVFYDIKNIIEEY